jgi:hypothetical protein
MQSVVQIYLTIIGVVFVIFGIWHLFFPILLKWNRYYQEDKEIFIQTVQTTNFSFSVLIILIGLLNFYFALKGIAVLQSNKIVLIVELCFLVLRLIYSVINPIRIKIKGYNLVFQIVFILVGMLIYISIRSIP